MFNLSETQLAKEMAKLHAECRDIATNPQICGAELSYFANEVMNTMGMRGYCQILTTQEINGIHINDNLAFDCETGVLYTYTSRQEKDGITWNGDDVYHQSYKTIIEQKKAIGKIEINQTLDYTDEDNLKDLAFDIITTLRDMHLIRNRYHHFNELPKSNGIVDLSKLDEHKQRQYRKTVVYLLDIINNPDNFAFKEPLPKCPDHLEGKQSFDECTIDDLQYLEKYMKLTTQEQIVSTIV